MIEINKLLKLSVEQNASDLHLTTKQPPILRIDGELQSLDMPPSEAQSIKEVLSIIMNNDQLKNYEKTFECDFSYILAGVSRFRVNAYLDINGPAIAFRTIPERIPTFEEIGLPESLQGLCQQPNGIVLVTGPTGSGKSTTLATMIDYINETHRSHILTVEDPIEFCYHSKQCLVNQREINHHTKSFHTALRAALREDPDIILVGEMRDTETIRLALTAAETGHLVFATLHTNSAATTINRLIDVFPAGEKDMVRSMISESLRAVIAQHLFKKIGGGRVAVREIMITTPAIANMIREDKIPQLASAIQTGQTHGMVTMERSIQQLITDGILEPTEAANTIKNRQ